MLLGPPDSPEIINNETEVTGKNVTVMWRRASDNNCHITMYALHYRIVGPAMDTLHYRIFGPALKDENWSSVNIINTTFYQIRITASV